MGGVTGSIRKELAANDLPYLNRSVETGEVAFIQNTGKFANASMIGYAASVDAYKKKLLMRILYARFCEESNNAAMNSLFKKSIFLYWGLAQVDFLQKFLMM